MSNRKLWAEKNPRNWGYWIYGYWIVRVL